MIRHPDGARDESGHDPMTATVSVFERIADGRNHPVRPGRVPGAINAFDRRERPARTPSD